MAALIRASRNTFNLARQLPVSARLMSDHWGSGAGRGGGSGGSVRDAGGAFGKMEAAHEEQYFRRLQARQLEELRKQTLRDIVHEHEIEIQRHEEAEKMKEYAKHLKNEIKEHEEAIERHKKKLEELHGNPEKSGSDTD